MSKVPGDQHEDELPLRSVLAHVRFPGRSLLYVKEVAEAWECDLQHVYNLIETGELDAVDIARKGTPSGRQTLRVPVSAYDKFLTSRHNNSSAAGANRPATTAPGRAPSRQ